MDLSTGLGLKGLKQLRRAWIEVEQEALSRITGKVRPALPKDDLHLIRRQIDDCLSETGGAASARARAARLGGVYLDLDAEGRNNFLKLLAFEYGVKDDALRESARAWLALDSEGQAADLTSRLDAEARLRRTLQSPRMRLLTQFNDLPEGVKFLADMRAQLL